MSGADSETVQFVGLNIIVIAVVLLLLFGYLVLLIRKRWKANFLHPVEPKKHQGKEKP
jgi:Flp pilus assembly protein CpaB